MPRFKLVSTECASQSVGFEGLDASCAIEVAAQSPMEEADLWQDDKYLYTMRKQGNAGDFWVIYRKIDPTGQDIGASS